MAISVVQTQTAAYAPGGASTSFNLNSFGSNVTAGNTIIVLLATYTTIPKVTDSLNNCYVCDGMLGSVGANNYTCWIFRAQNIAAGAPAITITDQGAGTSTKFAAGSAVEVSPITPSVNCGSTFISASGTTIATPSFTTLVAASIIFGVSSSEATGTPSVTPYATNCGSVNAATSNGEALDCGYTIESSLQTGVTWSWTWPAHAYRRAMAFAYVAAPAGGGGLILQRGFNGGLQ